MMFTCQNLAPLGIGFLLIASFVACKYHETVAEHDNLSPADCYEKLCNGDPVRLISISQVKEVAREARENLDIECPSKVRKEIEALNRLVSISENNACTNEKADALQEFTLNFIRGKFEEHQLLSKPIETFFVNYGMRIGEKCRQRMVDLVVESKSYLNQQDIDEMDRWAGNRSAISLVFLQKKSYDNLVLPKTLARSIESDSSPIYVLLSFNHKLQRFQAFCERRLKPIYEPLIAPQMTLSSIGFNLLGAGIANQLKWIKDFTLQWYRLVFLCESLGNIVLLGEPNETDTHQAPQEGTKLIKVCTKEELAKLKDSNNQTIEIRLDDSVNPEIKTLTDYDPTELKPVVLEDRIYCGADVCMANAVKKYMDNLEYKRRHKFLSSLMEPIANKLASGSIKLASKSLEVTHYESFIEFINAYESMSLRDQAEPGNLGLGQFAATALTLVSLDALKEI